MAEWTQIPADTFDIDRPILGSTHLAIVQNFQAMAEGAEGAPRINGTALTGLFLADSSASRSSNGTSTILTITNLNDISKIIAFVYVAAGPRENAEVNAGVGFRTSTNNGASYGSETSVLSVDSPPDQKRNEVRLLEIDVQNPVNAVQFRLTTNNSFGTGNGNARVGCFIGSGEA